MSYLPDPIFSALEVDVARTAASLPEAIRDLGRVAWNLAWTWLPDGPALFRDLDPELWEASGHNARGVLRGCRRSRLAECAADPGFLARTSALGAALDALLDQPLDPVAAHLQSLGEGRTVAYFSAEFGIHESLPIYSGGLGILAGDHLKSASDLGVPLVGVGLRYRQGYFRQSLDATGWQQERYEEIDFGSLPTGLILNPDGQPLTVEIPLFERTIRAQLWGVRVGRVPLLLLDTNRDDNSEVDRWITAHLYGGGRDTRLAQEVVLGIGGVLALRRLGYRPAVFHMNEGHAAFLTLQLIREAQMVGSPWEQALELTRSRCVFTTHTPVPAGHDAFAQADLTSALRALLTDGPGSPAIPVAELMQLGNAHPAESGGEFGMTPLAMHAARSINGVSRLHGEVCRSMWRGLWPGVPVEDVPITHVTNGVHLASWVAPLMRDLLDRYLGREWTLREMDPAVWKQIDQIPDEELWRTRRALKQRLAAVVRERARMFRAQGGQPPEYVAAADTLLDPEALTIGFARRVATYKRLTLLLHDMERALRLLGDPERPIQFVLAGKAHPGDEAAKRTLQQIFQVRHDPRVVSRAVFIVDYDASLARELVQGVDVWLNLPRRPLEASGTSGMKAVVNGVLNAGILDGWWAEGFNGANGWAVGSTESHPDTAHQDALDATALYDLLEFGIGPEYYRVNARGVPVEWLARVREAFRTLAPTFNTRRMVAEYATSIYPRP